MASRQMNLSELRRKARETLRTVGIESADIDSKILLCEVLGCSSSELIMRAEDTVSDTQVEEFSALLARRARHEPIAYIVGKQPFWSLEFHVTPDVLIPRPETEGVVERALDLMKEVENPRIVDVGTGSGAILLSFLHERKDARGYGLDISQKALNVAAHNAERLGVAGRAQFVVSDYVSAWDQQADIVVSNPPYITDAAMTELPATVADFEPPLALRGGQDGLVAYRSLVLDTPRVLRPKGGLVVEIGYDQGEAVAGLLRDTGFQDVRVDKDLAGHDRVVSGKLSV